MDVPLHRRLARRLAAATTALTLLAGGGALAVGLQLATAPPALALDNGLDLTPQMGFNNWNSTHCGAQFNEAMVEGIADLFVAKGLKAAGYQYVNLDDCWALPTRDANGNLVADPVRFPHGIKALADYVHAKGLKFGIYSSAGTHTCDVQGFPGGLGHEQQDADLWASWGVDYLKYDNCNNQGVDAQARYKAMGDALRATGRPILYSICEWGSTAPWTWASRVGDSWRTTGDISDDWSSMISRASANMGLAPFAKPGAFNDPDMLEVGNGGMTSTEYRTHFSLWSEMAAPLMIGTDLRTAQPDTLAILTNADVIAVDQDPLGKQGSVVAAADGQVVMSKPLADGSRAVTLTNEGSYDAQITATTAELGLAGSNGYAVKDLWSKRTSRAKDRVSATVPGHGTVMLRITPNRPVPPATGISYLSDLPFATQSNGSGPVERDLSNGGRSPQDGRTLSVRGTAYDKGLGVAAPSSVSFLLDGACKDLVTDVGVDDETGGSGAVDFQVLRDGVKVADSGVLTGADPAAHLSVDLRGAGTLTLVAAPGAGGGDAGHGDWAGARIACGAGPATGPHQVSDLTWSSAGNGWGPVEKDRSNGEDYLGDGGPLTVRGTAYAKGLGAHAASDVAYYLGGSCRSLGTDVGIDDETGGRGSVVFQVWADGVKVADSGLVTPASGVQHLTADLTGADQVHLVVTDGGDGNNSDHADWLQPVLTC
ncbi:NPCBM/NEW2 domain-containing protein [Kitasatospora sp. NPDC058965]|uniref:NPCBM/NEW2 domain-containing protein n=1 Tax=Kitasatospora sp. NPDC058965 TaxID=3346682 RepID=UPI0036CD45A5